MWYDKQGSAHRPQRVAPHGTGSCLARRRPTWRPARPLPPGGPPAHVSGGRRRRHLLHLCALDACGKRGSGGVRVVRVAAEGRAHVHAGKAARHLALQAPADGLHSYQQRCGLRADAGHCSRRGSGRAQRRTCAGGSGHSTQGQPAQWLETGPRVGRAAGGHALCAATLVACPYMWTCLARPAPAGCGCPRTPHPHPAPRNPTPTPPPVLHGAHAHALSAPHPNGFPAPTPPCRTCAQQLLVCLLVRVRVVHALVA